MSTHSLPKISQKEYLKKYLSGDKVKKRKKDKKHKKSAADFVKVKIIDDDINNFDAGPEIDEELLLAGEDAPQIVGEYIEEKLIDSKALKWKSIIIKDEPEDEHNELSKWGRHSPQEKVTKESVTSKIYSHKTPDNSPPRKSYGKRTTSSPRKYGNSSSPQRKSKRDRSPSRTKIKAEPHSPQNKKRNQDLTYRKLERKSSDVSPARRRRSSDQSPPRKAKSPSRTNNNRSSNPSSSRRRNSDQSPPRNGKSFTKIRRRGDSDQSPPRKDYKRSGQSSPRQKKYFNQTNLSGRHETTNYRKIDSDHSPPRSKKSDNSPPRHRRDSDQSPPRRNNKSDLYQSRHRRYSDQSPPRSSKRVYQSPSRHRRDSDQSPLRRGKNRESEKFPHRKTRNSSDESPPRKNKSPPFRRGRHTPDYSPPRKSKKSPDHSFSHRRRNSSVEIHRNISPTRVKAEKRTPDLSPQPRHSRWQKQESEKSPSPPPTHKPKPGKTLEGKKAGLQDAKAMQKESMTRRKQEDLLFEKMSSDISGRNAEVQVRSTGRKGRRAREAGEEDPEERRRKELHEEKKKLLYERWGRGLKQVEDHKNRMIEQEYESSKPLARYSNDEDLERHLKEQERAEDPMLEYMRQKRKEKEKTSGKPQIPRYEGPFPENRFNIRPGYRWDGVDRSNGYEKKYFAVQNEKQARQDEAYKYSVEDM